MGQAPGKIRNWPEYDLALKTRHRLDLWLDPDLVRHWREGLAPSGKAGRRNVYSAHAICFCAKFKELLGLTFRAVEGFLEGLFSLLGIDLKVPDHTTLSRRSAKDLGSSDLMSFGACDEGFVAAADSTGLKTKGRGEWLSKKHGNEGRRGWLKLHILIDVDTGEVKAAMATDDKAGDCEVLPDLLCACEASPSILLGDGAYETVPLWKYCDRLGVELMAPPRKGAKLGRHPLRDEGIRHDRLNGRGSWKKDSGYHARSLVETAMGRVKGIFGPSLACRSEHGQMAQIFVRLMCLNGMSRLGMPKRDARCVLRTAA